MSVRALAALLFLAGSAAAQPQGGMRRGPPPSAFTNCAGKNEGDACSFETPRGNEDGACYQVREGFACIPNSAPRPHPMGRREPPPDQEDQYQGEPMIDVRVEGAQQPQRRARAADPISRPSAAALPPALPAPAAPAPVEPAAPTAAPLAASVQALPVPQPAAPVQAAPEPAPPPQKKEDPLPWTTVFAAMGAVAGLLALWRTLNGSATAPVAAPPPTAPRGTAMPDLPPDSVPTAVLTPAPAAPAPAIYVPPPVGELEKNFKIVREIGVGGMGVVYEALDLKLDRRVALKKMRSELSQSARGRERFLAEAKVVAKLTHPNIVAIHGIVEEGRDLYLVFEYVEGETLDDLLGREKRLSGDKAGLILQGVADAVDYAHEMKVIHRDLKPSNIMIDKTGRPKVMDFGIAHQAKMTISQLTMAEAYGTLAYMPPEQELGQAVRESDVYAFAAVTYESLIGNLPFPGPNFHLQKASMSFTRPSFSFPPLTNKLDPVFEKAFQPEPKKRFATTGEFAKALSVALAA